MTVKELTMELRKMPQDAQVIMELARDSNGIANVYVDTEGDVVLSEFDD